MHKRPVVPVSLISTLAVVFTGCSLLDGPVGPFPGGRLRAGTLVSEPDVDWSAATRGVEPLFVELQLVDPVRSRTTGAMLHDGQLYVPCDLGFIWRRVPAPARWMLAGIYRVKRWHEDALSDGRVVLRIGSQLYERQAVRVADPQLLTALRSQVQTEAEKMLGTSLGELPSHGPRDIWFFRMDPRGSAHPERSADGR